MRAAVVGHQLHRVPLSGVAAFLAERRAAGVAADVKLLLLLASGILADA